MTLPEDREADPEEIGFWGRGRVLSRSLDILLLLIPLESPGEALVSHEKMKPGSCYPKWCFRDGQARIPRLPGSHLCHLARKVPLGNG